jgi:hypothetical protein
MSDLQVFCPQCQGMELHIERSVIIGADPGIARCNLCQWQGTPDDLLVAVSPENTSLWTGERVANVLLVAASKHAAGPMVQVLEVLGLVPPIQGGEQEQASAQHVREHVMKAVLEAVVTSAFESAAEVVPAHYQRFDARMAPAAERVFSFAGRAHDES